MIVAFDIGNSRFHFGWRDSEIWNTLELPNRFPRKDFSSSSTRDGSDTLSVLERTLLDSLDSVLGNTPEPMTFVGVTVHQKAADSLRQIVLHLAPNAQFRLIARNEIPISKRLAQPETVGIDRLLTAWFAKSTFGNNVIAVDAGTAVTVDWVDDEGVFRGGMIFPGFGLSADSLVRQTDALPEVPMPDSSTVVENVFGNDTVSAIQSGLFWSQWGGIKMAVQRLQDRAGSPTSIMTTGGGFAAFQELLPSDWHYLPNANLEAVLALHASKAD